MEMSAKKQLFPRRVLELSVDALRPNPNQPAWSSTRIPCAR